MKKSLEKAQKNVVANPSGARKRKTKRKETYGIYIYKVLKQVHPDTGVSSKAMSIMNSFVNDLFERIASEASRLAQYNKRRTITSKEIQTAVRLLLPGELAKHAVSEGTKAVTKGKLCIDSTHGTNQYNFNLTTIVVIDEFGEGYPADFCINTKVNEVHMNVFFLKIQEAIGCLAPNVFMSDDAPALWNAWIKTMYPSGGFGGEAMTDMVVMLLETPFRRWHSDNKNDLLKVGKPIPILSALAPDKKLSKVFCRSFNPNLYQQHSWLCGSHYIQKLFCWPCLLLGKMKSVWNTVGYYDLKNLSRGIQIHQTSKEHIHNHLGLKNLEKNYFSILDVVNEHGNLFKKNFNQNVRLNHLFMEHLIDLVLFLGKQELAFRGHDENSDSLNKGNFRELFDMHIIRCSQEIQNHYNSIKNIFSGMSKSIQNDLISCISEFLINQIKNEIKQCKFYSIQIDDTTDISQKTQCSIIIRYVTDKSELVERFLGFHNVSEDRTAQGLFNLVNSVLHEFDIENKLVGQCYDGACVMSGHLTGLQARVKEVAPNALFTHCLAHRLNLVLQHGCSINAKCRIFFANLTGIVAYFHNSTSRTNFVDTIVGKRIPQFVQTRWSSRSKILHTIVNEWSGFINVFDCISKDPKSSSESICGAIGHFKNLKTFEFAFLALVFNDIFIYTDNLFNILQNKSFDVEFCLRKINITYDLINKKRNEPEFLKLFNQAVTLTKPPKATRNESNNQSNFKILFYEIIDNILMQLNTRFQDTNKLLFLQLADVTKFKEYSCTFPVNTLNNLKSTYPNIFYNINTLKVELEVLYSDVKYQNLLHIYDMVKIIEQDALKDILPETYKLFILILTIPSTSVSNERSFSCLKRIKTCSRNSISQVRLSSLSILSIEKSLINQL
ncbi:hypothetical protein QTP88_005724 [Uroleucon formosanum]